MICFSQQEEMIYQDYSITDFAHNVRSLSKQIYGIVSDDRMITYNIAGFTEKQINASSSTYKIIETLIF